MNTKRELPIYKSTYELLLLISKITANFPRNYKRSLSEKMMDSLTSVIININAANDAKGQDKLPHIRGIIENVKIVEIMSRASTDLKLISIENFSTAVIHTDAIRNQAYGWESYVINPSVRKRRNYPNNRSRPHKQPHGV